MRAVEGLIGLCFCSGSSQPSLLDNGIFINIVCACLIGSTNEIKVFFASGYATLSTSGGATVLPDKSDSYVVFCLQLLSLTLTCTLLLSLCESIDLLELVTLLISGDTTLLDQLTHDTQMTSNIEQKWMDMAKQFPSR